MPKYIVETFATAEIKETWEAMSRRAVAMKSRLDDVWEKHRETVEKTPRINGGSK
jgi:hypothetical protein